MDTVLYIAAAVLIVIALLMAVSHLLGWSSERVSAPLRASGSEAVDRTADWAAEFWRFLRIGR